MVHAQKKVAEVEAAFLQLLQRPIRVQFLLDAGTEAKSVFPATVNPPSAPPPAAPKLNGTPPSPPAEIPPVNREVLPREVKPASTIPPSNGAHLAPAIASPQVSATPAAETLSTSEQSYSDNDLHKAAETIAKLFDGEIVQLEEATPIENPKTGLNIPKETSEDSQILQTSASNASLVMSPSAASPRILGRPDPSQLEDEEDLPF